MRLLLIVFDDNVVGLDFFILVFVELEFFAGFFLRFTPVDTDEGAEGDDDAGAGLDGIGHDGGVDISKSL